jgi:hypothetical protein
VASHPPKDPPDVGRARKALIHTLANCLNVVIANLEVLAKMQTAPEANAIMADVLLAAERCHRAFEALRRLG